MKAVAWKMVSGLSVAVSLVVVSPSAQAAGSGDANPSLSSHGDAMCPGGGDKKPSNCPGGGDKKPSSCPGGGDKKPSLA